MVQRKNLKSMKEYVMIMIMPNDDNKILKYNYEEKSLKVPAIIYADLKK